MLSLCRGLSITTSCDPNPSIDRYIPSIFLVPLPSFVNAGYKFGTTRVCQPPFSKDADSKRIASSRDSFPLQNGQVCTYEGLSGFGIEMFLKSCGRRPRPGAKITHSLVTLSCLTSPFKCAGFIERQTPYSKTPTWPREISPSGPSILAADVTNL